MEDEVRVDRSTPTTPTTLPQVRGVTTKGDDRFPLVFFVGHSDLTVQQNCTITMTHLSLTIRPMFQIYQ